MPAQRADRLSDALLRACGPEARCATNASGLPGTSRSWTGATDHTFDAGVAEIGRQASALYWVADED